MCELEVINQKIRMEFENKGGLELLVKFVMSEILSPIEDFQSAINIIRKNYHKCVNCQLLIIGSFLISSWNFGKNEFLCILNSMHDFLPDKYKAIVHFLNAYDIIQQDEENMDFNKCYSELMKTLDYNINFVYNYYHIANLVNAKESVAYYQNALNNVLVVNSEEDIMKLNVEYFLNPESFINERILGTHLNFVTYDFLEKELSRAIDRNCM